MTIYSVDNVTGSIYSICQKLDWGLEFIEHGASHFDESYVLAFHHFILLQSVRSRELMCDVILLEEFANIDVLEFHAVVTLDMLDDEFKVIMGLTSESLEAFLGLGFIFREINPDESRKIIKND